MNNKYYNHYKFEDIEKDPNFDTSGFTYLKNFKAYLQKSNNTCAPCCALMILNYYNDFRYNEEEIALIMKTKPCPIGTDFIDIINFFTSACDEEHEYQCFSNLDLKVNDDGKYFSTFDDFKAFLIENLKQGYPIILENVDYGGHYKVLIGYDEVNGNYEEDILIFADPSDLNDGLKDGYSYFPADRFYFMWFDDHCLSKEYRTQPFIVVKKL